MDFKRAESTCYRPNFPYAGSSEQNGAFSYIVLLVMHITYTRGLIGFSNCARLFEKNLAMSMTITLNEIHLTVTLSQLNLTYIILVITISFVQSRKT